MSKPFTLEEIRPNHSSEKTQNLCSYLTSQNISRETYFWFRYILVWQNLLSCQSLECPRPAPWSSTSRRFSERRAVALERRSPEQWQHRLKFAIKHRTRLLPPRRTWTQGWLWGGRRARPGEKWSALQKTTDKWVGEHSKWLITFKMMIGCFAGFCSSKFLK